MGDDRVKYFCGARALFVIAVYSLVRSSDGDLSNRENEACTPSLASRGETRGNPVRTVFSKGGSKRGLLAEPNKKKSAAY